MRCSRPKSVNEVAYQEEVVQTLQKALESANVRSPSPSFGYMFRQAETSRNHCACAAATPALLRASRHGQDVHSPGNGQAAVRVRSAALRGQHYCSPDGLLSPQWITTFLRSSAVAVAVQGRLAFFSNPETCTQAGAGALAREGAECER